MENSENRQDLNGQGLNELFDAALAGYGSEDPRPGLEGRILARLKNAEGSGRPRLQVWGLAVSTAVLVLLAVILAPRRRPAPAASGSTMAAPQPGISALAVAPKAHELNASAARPPSVTVQVRRPEQFPTPAPLSEQEKMLLLYVKEQPRPVLAAPAAKPAGEELEIPELTIASLKIKGLPRPPD